MFNRLLGGEQKVPIPSSKRHSHEIKAGPHIVGVVVAAMVYDRRVSIHARQMSLYCSDHVRDVRVLLPGSILSVIICSTAVFGRRQPTPLLTSVRTTHTAITVIGRYSYSGLQCYTQTEMPGP